ncbi:MAG: 50S ribosomal protein L11 [Candidatus Pacebacteria bacterium]|nr:50S ribosomal protein L11 [Candidatus Paceibacterota bacterium]
MAKKVTKKVKLQIPGGKATPAPPIGPALGQAGINIGDFTKKFNEATKTMMGEIVPVLITVYDDRSYTFVLRQPSATNLILKAAGVEKGAGKHVEKKAGSITKAKLREIAERKMPDLNANDIEGAMAIMGGAAKSLGIDIKG